LENNVEWEVRNMQRLHSRWVVQLSNSWSKPLQALALTMFVFGLLVWLYVVAVQLTRPDWLPIPFSHYDFLPFNLRLDDLGMLSFAVAAFGFFVWQLEKEE
jgi:hypothetical protein